MTLLVVGFCGEHEKEAITTRLAGMPEVADHAVTLRPDGKELVVLYRTNAVFISDAIERAGSVADMVRERDLDVSVRVRRVVADQVRGTLVAVQVA